jgi:hypothetical protein
MDRADGSHTPPIQAGVILYLHRHTAVALIQIAEAFGVQTAYLDPLLEELFRKRLIRGQTQSEEDAEIKWNLTEEGVEFSS